MEWRLTFDEKPILVNAERTKHWSVRNAHTSEWRKAFFWLCQEQKIPACGSIQVAVEHTYKGRKPDIGACYPSVKAAVDGVVDAGVIPDDSGAELTQLTFLPPVHAGAHSVTLIVTGKPA